MLGRSPAGQFRHLHVVTCSCIGSSSVIYAGPVWGELGTSPEVSDEISRSSCWISSCDTGVDRYEYAPSFCLFAGGINRASAASGRVSSTLASRSSSLTSSVNSLEACDESGEPGESAIAK